MMKITKLQAVTFFFLFLMMFGTSCNKQKNQKPNIIFIMSDDHAFQAISAYDDKLIATPNIDRLANEGIRFDRAYVTNSICSPSRAVILTGKHSHLNGVRSNINVFDSAQQTFPKLLQKAGYETAVIGKWHLKSEPSGFDYWRVLPDQGVYYQPEFRTPGGGIVSEQGYVTDVVTNLTLDWLDNLRDKNKPFMLMYQHKAPHREWYPAQEYLDEFVDKPIPVPETLFDDYAGRGTAAHEAEMRIKEHMGLSIDNKIDPEILNELGMEEFYQWYGQIYQRNYNLMSPQEQESWDAVFGPINEAFLKNPPKGDSLVLWKYKRYMEDYLACIKSVDDNIGRLLDYLEETGLDENTLVVYTSDQGFYLGEHGWFDKRFMYEESFRTPLLMRWPGKIKPATVNENLVQNLDFAQTFLDIAGAELPADMQGLSLVPLFNGNTKYWRDALYYHYYEYPGIHGVKRHYGISTSRYKLIHFYYDIDEWELYDLETDPGEMHNLIDDPKAENIKNALMKKLTTLRKEYGDSDELTMDILENDLKQ
jgi:arylsulfatase A-like enzyme